MTLRAYAWIVAYLVGIGVPSVLAMVAPLVGIPLGLASCVALFLGLNREKRR